MNQKKLDGIIEAVHYTPAGKIVYVRAYERRGAVWSDVILLDRAQLSDRIKAGKRFMTGSRTTALGSVFKTSTLVTQPDETILTEGQNGSKDNLMGVPVL